MGQQDKAVETAERKIKRRKSPKGAMRREEILNAAMLHFAHDGYQNSSFAAIAEDVGLTLPGLLHYFPTKVDLLLAILNKRDVDSLPVLTQDGDDWRHFLLGLVEVVRRNQTIPGVVRTFAVLNAESLTRDHPAEQWFGIRVGEAKAHIVRALKAGLDAGNIRQDIEPDNIAAELIAMMDGLQMLWLRKPREFDMHLIFADYVDRLIGSIEAPAP